jgi:hypothetical protein
MHFIEYRKLSLCAIYCIPAGLKNYFVQLAFFNTFVEPLASIGRELYCRVFIEICNLS